MIRAALLLSIALTAGCGRREPDTAPIAAAPPAGLPAMPCAIGRGAVFAETCTVERIASARGWTLVIHHPDGGFRRLSVATDGRGVIAADGAEPARVTVLGPGSIEVGIADDRYRLPATIEGRDAAAR